MHQAIQRIIIFWCFIILVLLTPLLVKTNTSHAAEAILSWEPPTTNADGTPLNDLAGHKVYYGTASKTYNSTLDVGNVTTYTISNLAGNATYYFAVTAYDTSGNESGYSDEVFKTITDTIPPVISGVTTNNITSTGAVITWGTDEASTSQVEYGTDTSYGSFTSLDSTPVTSHSVTLSGLSAWTTYHFRVKSQDSAGNLAISADYTFTTIAPPDTTPPGGTISINSGATYTSSTTVTLTLSCTDAGSGCWQMQFSNDGTTWNPWETYTTGRTWTLSSGDGNKTVYARYKDNDNNISQNYTDTITLDTSTPVLSVIKAESITSNSAAISWMTSEGATGQVEYGTNTGYGSTTAIDTNLVTDHSISLTGLSPSTTYHFRVKSQDAAGNLAVSADYTFVTLNPPQPDQPATITDLRIKSGYSTRSSVILEWTATGADGTEGTASLYDLIISTLKIIEDGLTPGQGEINFSSANKVTGIPTPQVAGTSESFQVNQLETNSVYYFAIKAIDNKGNTSAISNVVNGDDLPPLPATAVRQGYTMISFPLVPATSDVQELLGGIVGSPVELYWWNSYGYIDMDGVFSLETNVVPGYSYFLKSNIDNAVLNVSGTVITDASRALTLQPGWNMIGNPYPKEVALRNTYIRKIDTGEMKSFEDAVIAGWAGNAIYKYNGSTYDLEFYTEAVLRLWQGYWLAVLKDGQYEMIIYGP